MLSPEYLATIAVVASIASCAASVVTMVRAPNAKQLAAHWFKFEQDKVDAERASKARLDKNPFNVNGSNWSLTEQTRLLCTDYDAAVALINEADPNHVRIKIPLRETSHNITPTVVEGDIPAHVSDESAVCEGDNAPEGYFRQPLRVPKQRRHPDHEIGEGDREYRARQKRISAELLALQHPKRTPVPTDTQLKVRKGAVA